MTKKEKEFSTQFESEVYHGLTSSPKNLSSKYFYDKKGDDLFQQIMELPEYYLTSCEYEILDTQKQKIAAAFSTDSGFDLIELGAGDGKKTKILLKHFLEQQLDFAYYPIDISKNVLQQLTSSLKNELPGLEVTPKNGTYNQVLEELANFQSRRKIVLFLGSNIGNLTPTEALEFLKNINSKMNKEDLLFIGFDQKKDPATILSAYNDSSGVTAAFNKNILQRINRELGADFQLESFLHWPVYHPQTGEAKSFLISKKQQKITLKALNLTVPFHKWEGIQTELSRKFDDASVEALANDAGFRIEGFFTDGKEYFRNYIFKKLP